MALEISATPILEGEDAKRFLQRVGECAHKSSKRINASKLAHVAKQITERYKQIGDYRSGDG